MGDSEAELFRKILVKDAEGREEEDEEEWSIEFTGPAINGVAISSNRIAEKGGSQNPKICRSLLKG